MVLLFGNFSVNIGGRLKKFPFLYLFNFFFFFFEIEFSKLTLQAAKELLIAVSSSRLIMAL